MIPAHDINVLATESFLAMKFLKQKNSILHHPLFNTETVLSIAYSTCFYAVVWKHIKLWQDMLAYGSEAWMIIKADKKRLLASEMKFMRSECYTLLDHKWSDDF